MTWIWVCWTILLNLVKRIPVPIIRRVVPLAVAVLTFGLCVTLFGIAIYRRAAARVIVLSKLVGAVEERLVLNETSVVLSHFAAMPKVLAMDPTSCEDFRAALTASEGFFSVLAVGDREGNPVCTADPAVSTPLPTMKDREYFLKAKVAEGMVSGGYATSRTTGKPLLHFAYPVRDAQGEFRGIVLAGVDLGWFVTPDLESAFAREGVTVEVVDGGGLLLFSYPMAKQRPGQYVMSPRVGSVLLSNSPGSRIVWDDLTHEYRLYAYQWVDGQEGNLAVVAEISFARYWWIGALAAIVSAILAAGVWAATIRILDP